MFRVGENTLHELVAAGDQRARDVLNELNAQRRHALQCWSWHGSLFVF